uniref:Secreted RxLR effector protein 22 n=1 Tax=Plasmopara viticola TaxID=143451 RepID=RLR22_PLAVT|nr:RecName: Full=Secreted RxLR effector protein 22; Flags: Precursor [Plasmopara viticola]ANC73375.1 secreted RxLR effector peptide protein 22 [Plasmopara viticola]
MRLIYSALVTAAAMVAISNGSTPARGNEVETRSLRGGNEVDSSMSDDGERAARGGGRVRSQASGVTRHVGGGGPFIGFWYPYYNFEEKKEKKEKHHLSDEYEEYRRIAAEVKRKRQDKRLAERQD